MDPEQQADAHNMEPGVLAIAFPQAGDTNLSKQISKQLAYKSDLIWFLVNIFKYVYFTV